MEALLKCCRRDDRAPTADELTSPSTTVLDNPDLLRKILLFLPPRDVRSAELVSKTWRPHANRHRRHPTVPEGTTRIDVKAFRYRTDILEVTIPSSVTEIGDNAFHDCKNLRRVVFEGGSRLTTIAAAG